MSGLAEEIGKQFEEQQALIRELEHQVERLRHFEQVHIDNLDHYREQIAAIEAEHRVEIADMAERFRAVNVAEAVQQITGHEALIRELVAMIGQALADTERNPLETGFNHSSETTRELARGLILVRNGLFDALAKAKAAGFEP